MSADERGSVTPERLAEIDYKANKTLRPFFSATALPYVQDLLRHIASQSREIAAERELTRSLGRALKANKINGTATELAIALESEAGLRMEIEELRTELAQFKAALKLSNHLAAEKP